MPFSAFDAHIGWTSTVRIGLAHVLALIGLRGYRSPIGLGGITHISYEDFTPKIYRKGGTWARLGR